MLTSFLTRHCRNANRPPPPTSGEGPFGNSQVPELQMPSVGERVSLRTPARRCRFGSILGCCTHPSAKSSSLFVAKNQKTLQAVLLQPNSCSAPSSVAAQAAHASPLGRGHAKVPRAGGAAQTGIQVSGRSAISERGVTGGLVFWRFKQGKVLV